MAKARFKIDMFEEMVQAAKEADTLITGKAIGREQKSMLASRAASRPIKGVTSVVRQPSKYTRDIELRPDIEARPVGGVSITDVKEIARIQQQIAEYTVDQNKDLIDFIDVKGLRTGSEHAKNYVRQLENVQKQFAQIQKDTGVQFEFVLDSSLSKRAINTLARSGKEDALAGATFSMSLRASIGDRTIGETRLPFITGVFGSYGRGMNVAPIAGFVATEGLEGFGLSATQAGKSAVLMPYNEAVLAQVFKAINSDEWRDASSAAGKFKRLKGSLVDRFQKFYEPSRPRQRQVSDKLGAIEQVLHSARIVFEDLQDVNKKGEVVLNAEKAFNVLGEQMSDPTSDIHRILPAFTRDEISTYGQVLQKSKSGYILKDKTMVGATSEAIDMWNRAVGSRMQKLFSGTTSSILFENQMSIHEFFGLSERTYQREGPAKALANTTSWNLTGQAGLKLRAARKMGIDISVASPKKAGGLYGKLVSALSRNVGYKATPHMQAGVAFVHGAYQEEFVDYLVGLARKGKTITEQGRAWGFKEMGRDIVFGKMSVAEYTSQYNKWARAQAADFPLLVPEFSLGAIGSPTVANKASGMFQVNPYLDPSILTKTTETFNRWGIDPQTQTLRVLRKEALDRDVFAKKGALLAQIIETRQVAGETEEYVAKEIRALHTGLVSLKHTQGSLSEEVRATWTYGEDLTESPAVVIDEIKATAEQNRVGPKEKLKGNVGFFEEIYGDPEGFYAQRDIKGRRRIPVAAVHAVDEKLINEAEGIVLTKTRATAEQAGGVGGAPLYRASTPRRDARIHARSVAQTQTRKLKVRGRYKTGRDAFVELYGRHFGGDKLKGEFPKTAEQFLETYKGKSPERAILRMARQRNIPRKVKRELLTAFNLWQTEMSEQATMGTFSPMKTTFRDQLMITGRAFGSEGGMAAYVYRQSQLREAIIKGSNAKYLRGAMMQVDTALPFFQGDYLDVMRKAGRVIDIDVGAASDETMRGARMLSKFFEVKSNPLDQDSPETLRELFKDASKRLGHRRPKDTDAATMGFRMKFSNRADFTDEFLDTIMTRSEFWTGRRAMILKQVFERGIGFASNEELMRNLDEKAFGMPALKTRAKIYNAAVEFAESLADKSLSLDERIAHAQVLTETIENEFKSTMGNAMRGKGGSIAKAFWIEEEGAIVHPMQIGAVHKKGTRAFRLANKIAHEFRTGQYTGDLRQLLKSSKGARQIAEDLATVFINPDDMKEFMRGTGMKDTDKAFGIYRRWPDLSTTNQQVVRLISDPQVARGKAAVGGLLIELAKGDFDFDMGSLTFLPTGRTASNAMRRLVDKGFQATQQEMLGELQYYATGYQTLKAVRELSADVERDELARIINRVSAEEDRIRAQMRQSGEPMRPENIKAKTKVDAQLHKIKQAYRRQFGALDNKWERIIKGQLEYGLETGKVSNLSARVLAAVSGEALEQGALFGEAAGWVTETGIKKKELLPGLYDALSFTLSEARIREFKDTKAINNALRAKGMYALLQKMERGHTLGAQERTDFIDSFKASLGRRITDEDIKLAGVNTHLGKLLSEHKGKFMLDIGDQALPNEAFLSLTEKVSKGKEHMYLLDDERFGGMADILREVLAKRTADTPGKLKEIESGADLLAKTMRVLTSKQAKGESAEYVSELFYRTQEYLAKHKLDDLAPEAGIPLLHAVQAAVGVGVADPDMARSAFRDSMKKAVESGRASKDAQEKILEATTRAAGKAKEGKLINTILSRSLIPEGRGAIAGLVAFAGGVAMAGMFGDTGELLPPTPVQEVDPSVTQRAITAPPAYLHQQSAIGSRMVANGYSSDVPGVVNMMNTAGMTGSVNVNDNMTNDINFMYSHHQRNTGRF